MRDFIKTLDALVAHLRVDEDAAAIRELAKVRYNALFRAPEAQGKSWGEATDVLFRYITTSHPALEAMSALWRGDDQAPLPADIPRGRVADLHAAVTKRAEQLAAHGGGTVGTWLHAELSEVAEALRLLLEVPDAD